MIVVIPARYGSTRLPGKPLLDIAGKPMIQRVWEQCSRAGAERVVIATDDARIEQVVRGFGAESCMTRSDHCSGTDRLQEVAVQLGLANDEQIINVQGDEPLMPAQLIRQVADNLTANPSASVATLSEPLAELADLQNPNIVKVVSTASGIAMYFSRAPIPWARDAFAVQAQELPDNWHWQRHIGIYGYRVGLLHRFVEWGPSALEAVESLEQLRVLWHGELIHVAQASASMPGGVDTEADLQRVRAWFEEQGE